MDKYIGKKLDGRYEIQELIGFGGMAVVFKAYDVLENRYVAVKILKEEYLNNEEFRRRFRNESKAIAMLSHPNIVKIFDVNLSDSVQYIVMEYIDGITLKEYISQQKVVRWKEAIHFTVQILRALQHAHDNGIVHRDVKPQNVMLLQDGTIKVMDFGIARFARENGRTVADKAIGSVHYISPEQARGEQTDERTDIYAVGIILYEMLTGQVPFDGETPVAIAIKQMQEEPRLLTDINPDVPVGLEEIALRAMQKDRALRYQSASEMLKDIDEFKQNPDVVFEYKYFNEDGSTKYFERPEVHDQAAKASREKHKKKGEYTISILAGVAVACVLLAAVAVFFFFKSLGQKTPDVVLPDLTGKTVEEAQKELPNVKIVIKDKIPSAEYDVNQIISQEPAKDMTVKVGSEVEVIVSSGMQTIPMPDVVGKTVSEAREALAGYEIEEIRQTNSEVEAGCIISTNPKAGEDLEAGATVTLFVSLGSADLPVQVPDLWGMTVVSARNRLTLLGLSLGTVTEVESDEPEGTIVSQSIKKDSRVSKGTAINVEVSKGASAEEISVPISIKFPSDASDKSYSFVISVNGTLLETKQINPKQEGTLSMVFVSMNGKVNGKVTEQEYNEVEITVNGRTFAKYVIDFKTQSASTKFGPDYSLIKDSAPESSVESSEESSETSESSKPNA